ncbi:MAG: BCAM0308 family protein [Gemmatimonadota bacterium]
MTGSASFARKPQRRDRLIREHVHDPYKVRVKLPEPTVCTQCGAIWLHGRWQWGEATAGAHGTLCPACQRVRDKAPAGLLWLGGEFFRAHREEILNLARNHVEQQRREHPLKRLLGIEERAEGIEISFTDTHLPRGVGEAIERAFDGALEIQYTDESNLVRVRWVR